MELLIDDVTRRHSGGESRDLDEHDDEVSITFDELGVVVIVDVARFVAPCSVRMA